MYAMRCAALGLSIGRLPFAVLLLAMLGAGSGIPLHAQATPPQTPVTDTVPSTDSVPVQQIQTLEVTGRADELIGTAGTASEGRVGSADLRSRPITREGELLETVPGVIVTQHSGEGKANQYFVRGFNLDHGSDFETRIEGMPVNMVSHAHGQGWTDLNFLIPELVDYLDYHLGVYHTELGDFGSAGGAEFHLIRQLDRPFASVGTGENGLARLAAGGSGRVGAGNLLLAGEVKGYNGPWELAEEIRKFSGASRYTWEHGASRFSILGLAYRNRWASNDQIPARAVTNGLISNLGQIDSSDGGRSQRYSLSGSWRHAGTSSVQDVQVFGIYSYLNLFSDFTYFLNDPVRGDQFNQEDRRVIVGANAKHVQPLRSLGVDHVLKVGLQTRADFINGLGLYLTERMVRYRTVRKDDVNEWGSGVFVEAESRWHPRFRSVLGLRGDFYTFHVAGDRAENSGNRTAGLLSPKASLVFTPAPNAELYLSGGFAFHSNDARGTTITVDPISGDPVQRVDPLVRSKGAEIGARLTPVPGLRTTVALWALNLDSELLFVGDAGATEPSDESRRSGVTLANFYRPIPELALDLDVSLARARLSGVPSTENRIPGALENVVAAGVAWTPAERGLFGALRLRHFGSYPLIEDNSSRATATTLFNVDAGYRLSSGLQLQLTMLNLFDSSASDIQYFYASRLQGEPAQGVDDVHFHLIEPRQLRVAIAWGR